MLENVRLISKVNKFERREALIKILKENDLKYKMQHEKFRNHFVENIILPFNSEIRLPKLVMVHIMIILKEVVEQMIMLLELVF